VAATREVVSGRQRHCQLAVCDVPDVGVRRTQALHAGGIEIDANDVPTRLHCLDCKRQAHIALSYDDELAPSCRRHACAPSAFCRFEICTASTLCARFSVCPPTWSV